MSDQVDLGGGLGEFLWDSTPPWVFYNSGNSGGSDPIKLMESTTNSPTNCPTSTGGKRGHDGTLKGSSSKDGPGEAKIGGGGEFDQDMHIWTERERRKKMRNMFSGLHALLPQLPPKADKSTIVDEAVNYIKSLQQTLEELQKQKLERIRGENPSSSEMAAAQRLPEVESRESFLANQVQNLSAANSPTAVSIPLLPQCFQTWSSPNVVLNVTGDDAYINICTGKKPNLFTIISYVLEKHKLEVVSAQISSDCSRSMYMIHARVTRSTDQFLETLITEEIFKLAVGEILLWIS